MGPTDTASLRGLRRLRRFSLGIAPTHASHSLISPLLALFPFLSCLNAMSVVHHPFRFLSAVAASLASCRQL